MVKRGIFSPTQAYGAIVQGGYLPHVTVTSLSLSIGNIDVNTGMPNLAGPYDPSKPTSAPDPDLLMASAFGRGEFAINIGPIISRGYGYARSEQHVGNCAGWYAARDNLAACLRRPEPNHWLRERNPSYDCR